MHVPSSAAPLICRCSPACFFYAELLWPVFTDGASLDYGGLGLPRVAAWRASLWRQPAVQAVLRELAPAGEEWLAGKLRQ